MADIIELTATDGFKFPAFEVRPTGRPKGAVVVLQEIFGLNSHIRAVTEAFAAQGYLALAPSTFHRVQPDVDMGYSPQDVAAGVALKAAVEALPPPGVLVDIQAAIDHGASAGKVGVVGYCWGGLLAWRAASLLSGLSAAVSYYGGGMTGAAEIARTPQCPVLAHFGDHDPSIPLAGVEAFKNAQPSVEMHLYQAAHGFNCDHRSAYDASAAALARERTLAFFARLLA